METISTDNGTEIGLIYKTLFFQDGAEWSSLLQGRNGIGLDGCRYLGIRDHGGKKKCVCMTTGRAINAGNRKDKDMIPELYPAFVRTIKNKTAGKTASTGNLVQINRMDYFIIKILRNIVVVFCFNCYHSIGHSISYGCS